MGQGKHDAALDEDLRALLAELDTLDENSDYREPEFEYEQVEPDLLRREYYYSRYPDNAEEFEGDYF